MKLIITIALIFVMASCTQGDKYEVSLEQKSYKLYRGDKLIRKSENTQIEISQNSEQDYAIVTVIKGNVEVIRRN